QAGPHAEGLRWLRRFLDGAPLDLPDWLRLRALWCAGWMASQLGDGAAVRAYTSDGLRRAEARQDDWARVLFLILSAALARQDGNLAVAQSATEQRLALARRIGSISAEESALIQLGNL